MIPTEPIGSIPRPLPLIQTMQHQGHGHPDLEPLYEAALRSTIARFEATGSPVVTDGEQCKYHNFWTSTSHDTAFAKIAARVHGTALAAHLLGA